MKDKLRRTFCIWLKGTDAPTGGLSGVPMLAMKRGLAIGEALIGVPMPPR